MLKTKDKQELFDLAYNGVVSQGMPSMNEGNCLYDGGDGIRCAAGHCLDDDALAFASDLEVDSGEMDIETLYSVYKDHYGKDLDEDLNSEELFRFLNEMQICHDLSSQEDKKDFIKNFKKRMEEVRTYYLE